MKYLDRKTGETKEVTLEQWDTMHGKVALPAYIQARLAAYPSIGDQLDLLYHDMIGGTNKWQETIGAIKAANPKPVD